MGSKTASKLSNRNVKQYIIWFLLLIAIVGLEYKFGAVSSVLKDIDMRDFKVKVEIK